VATDFGDAIELFGRFAVFWGFLLKPQFRRVVLEEWRQQPRPGQLLSLLEGLGNAVIGLLPLAALGFGIWWLV